MSVTAGLRLTHDLIIGHFLPNPPESLAAAVSGGGDSLGVLSALSEWAEKGGPALSAVTVDHGLRPESRDEALYVAQICAELSIPHEILEWRGWDGQGNLQDQARRARYKLIADWSQQNGVFDVALGHTADDVAETFLMRLAREAGVDGLSAMRGRWRVGAMQFHRPALRVRRAALRDVLRSKEVRWIEDPSNIDETFERVRVRKALEALASTGITVEGLSHVADRMAKARDALYWYAFVAARDCVAVEAGDLVVGRKNFRTLHDEVARRLLQEALKWVSGAEYGPRGRAVDLALESIRGGTSLTLQGCLISVSEDQIRISREFKAVAGLRCPPGRLWDGRWRLTGPVVDGVEIRALGEAGLADCSEWRDTGMPRQSLLSSPALWVGNELVAAPLAGRPENWTATLERDGEDFFAALLSH